MNGKQLSDMRELEAEGKPTNGETPTRPVRSWSCMGVSTSTANMRETQAGSGGRCESAGEMECKGVTQ
jgi:hypothetical protein